MVLGDLCWFASFGELYGVWIDMGRIFVKFGVLEFTLPRVDFSGIFVIFGILVLNSVWLGLVLVILAFSGVCGLG